MRVTTRSAVAWVAVVGVLTLIGWGVQSKPATRAPAHPVAGHSYQTASPPPSDSAPPSESARGGTAPPSDSARRAWKLKFNAHFTGSRLNTNIWGTCYPWHDVPAGCTNYGNHHNQREWNLAAQDRVANGTLELVAQRMPTQGQNKQGQPETYGCRSGMVTTYPGFRFKYGYIRIVARIPYGYGLWPGINLVAANLKWPPEIDMMEHWASRPSVRETAHLVGLPQTTKKVRPGNLSVGWHSFDLLWSPSKLVWFIDGHEGLIVRYDIPDIPMYLIVSLADNKPVQADQGCDGTMLIRSVQVWQQH